MSQLLGKWSFVRNENMDAFFGALGFTDDMKRTFLDWKPTIEIIQSGDSWTLKHTRPNAGVPDMEVTFKLGEEVENHSPSGVLIKSIYTLEGDTLTERQIRDKGDITLVRKAAGDQLIVTVSVQGVTGTTYFSKN